MEQNAIENEVKDVAKKQINLVTSVFWQFFNLYKKQIIIIGIAVVLILGMSLYAYSYKASLDKKYDKLQSDQRNLSKQIFDYDTTIKNLKEQAGKLEEEQKNLSKKFDSISVVYTKKRAEVKATKTGKESYDELLKNW